MNSRGIRKTVRWGVCLLLAGVLLSCGSMRKTAISSKKGELTEQDPLTYEQRRKFDYFFLEAVRLKEKGDLDAAF
ncbi:MAG: hypothetical protein IJ456_02090, partial [Bacteroides sp.]|nr:hypothetical protein [Bacteroides sp.]